MFLGDANQSSGAIALKFSISASGISYLAGFNGHSSAKNRRQWVFIYQVLHSCVEIASIPVLLPQLSQPDVRRF